MISSLTCSSGQHRSLYTQTSKGKRSKKRKKREGDAGGLLPSAGPPRPLPPDITASVVAGFNTVTRQLETAVASLSDQDEPNEQPHSRFSIIFIVKSKKDDLVYSHLPLLAYTVSKLHPDSMATRIVPLNPPDEQKIAVALGLPRVGMLAIMEKAPGAEPLLSYVQDHVEPMENSWTQRALNPRYHDLRVQTITPGTGPEGLKEH